MLNIFIGYDSREPVAYHVLAHSILARSSRPVSITPLVQSTLRERRIYTRERGATESTEFSLTRFLVPYLSEYKGISIFLDCDMLCLADITDLEFEICAANQVFNGPMYEQTPTRVAVMCAQHDYTPKPEDKFLGQPQTAYPRKNWSSLMVFDNAQCKALTPEYVNSASGLDLHRFNWLKDEQIGKLPLEWNWLVGEYPDNPAAKILHYTRGGPWFKQYRNTGHASEWTAEIKTMLAPCP